VLAQRSNKYWTCGRRDNLLTKFVSLKDRALNPTCRLQVRDERHVTTRIGRTNRALKPCGIRQQVESFHRQPSQALRTSRTRPRTLIRKACDERTRA